MSATPPHVQRYRDAAAVAQAAAEQLLEAIVDAQTRKGHAHVVLTGGGVGTATLATLSRLPGASAVNWSEVDLWWGDERFLPAGDPERNETQARAALLDSLPVPPALVHAMPARGAQPWDEDPDEAAAAYATTLAAAQVRATSGVTATQVTEAPPTQSASVPAFDVVLLGVGPDGHVASLFPGHPALTTPRGLSAVAVRDSPKPPPIRVSLTFEALNRSEQVWLLAAGAEKAEAVGRAFSGATVDEIPAVGVRGTRATIWLVDEAAGAAIPAS